MPIGRNTLKILLALGALKVPARYGTVFATLLATLAIIFCVVPAVAVLPCTPVTDVTMAMALARSTAASNVLANDKVAFNTFLALSAHRVVLAETAFS